MGIYNKFNASDGGSDADESPAPDSDSSVELFNEQESTWMAGLENGRGNANSDGESARSSDIDDGSGSDSNNQHSNEDDSGGSDNQPDWPLAQESESDWDIDFSEEPSQNRDKPNAMSFEGFCEANEGQVRLLQWIRKNKIPRFTTHDLPNSIFTY